MSSRVAESEYARVMATGGAERTQGLVKLVRVYVDFAPAWASLAEEHWVARRREEALNAARRALAIDPGLHNGFTLDLKMATRPLLAQLAPKTPARTAPQSADSGASDPAGAIQTRGQATLANRQMLHTALGLRNLEERIALLQELEVLAPEDPELLFHLAKELAVAGRTEDARRAGQRLERCAPERYVELYAWAEKNLASARAAHASTSPPAAASSAPIRLPSDELPTQDRTVPPRARSVPDRDEDPERVFDEAATIDVTLGGESAGDPYDEEVTTRAELTSLMPEANIGDADGQTARLHLSELERLVAVSMDPKLDS